MFRSVVFLEEEREAWLALDPVTAPAERLLRGDLAVLSHASAVQAWASWCFLDKGVTFSSPVQVVSPNPDIEVHVERFGTQEWDLVEGLPVMRPERTVADLVRAGFDPSNVGQFASTLMAHGIATEADIVGELDKAFPAKQGKTILKTLQAIDDAQFKEPRPHR